MKVLFSHFSAGAVIRERYSEGVDYLDHKFDLDFEDTVYLLRHLKNDRSSLSVHMPDYYLRYYVDSDDSLRVEIDTVDGFWADTGLEIEAAIEILRMSCALEKFAWTVPTTDEEWDAYYMPDEYEDSLRSES